MGMIRNVAQVFYTTYITLHWNAQMSPLLYYLLIHNIRRYAKKLMSSQIVTRY